MIAGLGKLSEARHFFIHVHSNEASPRDAKEQTNRAWSVLKPLTNSCPHLQSFYWKDVHWSTTLKAYKVGPDNVQEGVLGEWIFG